MIIHYNKIINLSNGTNKWLSNIFQSHSKQKNIPFTIIISPLNQFHSITMIGRIEKINHNFKFSQLAEINRHVWVTAAGKGELELELSMMDVVQTHVIPSVEAIDPDVLQAIASLGCFKERDKLIQELLSPK